MARRSRPSRRPTVGRSCVSGLLQAFRRPRCSPRRRGTHTFSLFLGGPQESLVSSRWVFYLSYIRSELVRRKGRTILTLLGLAIGVAVVISISALSRGLD